MEYKFLFSAHRLIMVYICTTFHENILNGIRVIERTPKVNGRTDGRTDGHDIIRPVFEINKNMYEKHENIYSPKS